MATLLQSKVGDSGVYLLALVSGIITDVDAITLSQLSHKELAWRWPPGHTARRAWSTPR